MLLVLESQARHIESAGHSGCARNIEMARENISALLAQQARLLRALRELYDQQNDAPLEKYRKQWAGAMARASQVLADLEPPALPEPQT